MLIAGNVSNASDSQPMLDASPKMGAHINRKLGDSVPKEVSSLANKLEKGFQQDGKKWRSGAIEHRKVVKVVPNTAKWHYDEILCRTSDWCSAETNSSLTLSCEKGFEKTHAITTSVSVTVAAETALGVGASFYGVELSSSTSAQTSITYSEEESFSSTYSTSTSTSVSYNVSDLPNVVVGETGIASCIVADWIEVTCSVKEVEYWFWGTYTTHDWKDFVARFVVFRYNTYCLTNGGRGHVTDRVYND